METTMGTPNINVVRSQDRNMRRTMGTQNQHLETSIYVSRRQDKNMRRTVGYPKSTPQEVMTKQFVEKNNVVPKINASRSQELLRLVTRIMGT